MIRDSYSALLQVLGELRLSRENAVVERVARKLFELFRDAEQAKKILNLPVGRVLALREVHERPPVMACVAPLHTSHRERPRMLLLAHLRPRHGHV